MIGTDGNDRLRGIRKKKDVIVSLGGDDHISRLGYYDIVCSGPGDDLINGPYSDPSGVDLGPGNDRAVLPELGDFAELDAGAGDDDITRAKVRRASCLWGPATIISWSNTRQISSA